MKRLAAAPLPACPETVRLLPSPRGTAHAAAFALPAPAAERAATGGSKARLRFPAPFLAQLCLQGDDTAEARTQRRERARLAAKAYSAPRLQAAKSSPRQEWWV